MLCELSWGRLNKYLSSSLPFISVWFFFSHMKVTFLCTFFFSFISAWHRNSTHTTSKHLRWFTHHEREEWWSVMCDGWGIRECHSFNHILEFNEMNEREWRKRLILRIDKRNDCFEREGERLSVLFGKGEWGVGEWFEFRWRHGLLLICMIDMSERGVCLCDHP